MPIEPQTPVRDLLKRKKASIKQAPLEKALRVGSISKLCSGLILNGARRKVSPAIERSESC